MLTTNEWRGRGAIQDIGGFRLFTIDEGEAEQDTILLIHGFPTSSWDWWKIWDALREKHRLVALDLLGFGFSDKPARHDYSIMEQADIVEELVRRKNLRRFHVLAHDYGDTVAQELLARQNEGVGAGEWQSLCLLNGGLFPETHRARLSQKILLTPFGAIVTKLMNRKGFGASMSSIFGRQTPPTREELDAFWELINHNDGTRIFHRLINYIRDRRRYRERWVSALRQARVPIALINGSLDPVSGAHMVDRYLEVVGKPAYLARLDTIGHYPQMEDATAITRHYLTFLREHASPL